MAHSLVDPSSIVSIYCISPISLRKIQKVYLRRLKTMSQPQFSPR